ARLRTVVQEVLPVVLDCLVDVAGQSRSGQELQYADEWITLESVDRLGLDAQGHDAIDVIPAGRLEGNVDVQPVLFTKRVFLNFLDQSIIRTGLGEATGDVAE